MVNLKNELKTLLRHGATYGLGDMLSRVIGFLMIPVYTHYLSTSDYGINELVGLSAGVIGIVLSLGLAGAIYRFYFDKEVEDPNIVVSTAFVGVPILSFVGLADWLSSRRNWLRGYLRARTNGYTCFSRSVPSGSIWHSVSFMRT